jgi:hypothetical protein
MKSAWALALLAALALGCATSGAPGPADVAADPAPGSDTVGEEGVSTADATVARSRTWRLGAWVIDLVALDVEPRGTTFRLLDLKILKLLEVGRGDDYYSFALLETPGVMEPVTVRRDGPTQELRLLDVQVLALLRRTRESATQEETRVVKPPILRSLYGHQLDGTEEQVEYLFVFRQEVER